MLRRIQSHMLNPVLKTLVNSGGWNNTPGATVRTLLSLLAGVAMTPALVAAAFAADLPEYIPEQPEIVEVETSGWYLRGDVAYTFQAETDGYYYGWDAAAYPNLKSYHYERARYDWRYDLSVGVGYQYNENLRFDATVGYWGRDVRGWATSPAPCVGGVPGAASCRFDDTSDVTAWEFMANGYYDIGKWSGFTPYVGGGIGVARVKYGDLTNVATCVGAGGGDIAGCGYTGYHGGMTSNRFVWALMAGASYDLTARVKLDVGYRYAHYESGAAWGWDQFDTAAGARGAQSYDNGFDFHQIRAGLRVALW